MNAEYCLPVSGSLGSNCQSRLSLLPGSLWTARGASPHMDEITDHAVDLRTWSCRMSHTESRSIVIPSRCGTVRGSAAVGYAAGRSGRGCPGGRPVVFYPCHRVCVGTLEGGAYPLVAGVDVLGPDQVGDPGHAELFLDPFAG
jgi:hypothetical protein